MKTHGTIRHPQSTQQNIEATYSSQGTISLKRMITGNGNECSPLWGNMIKKLK